MHCAVLTVPQVPEKVTADRTAGRLSAVSLSDVLLDVTTKQITHAFYIQFPRLHSMSGALVTTYHSILGTFCALLLLA